MVHAARTLTEIKSKVANESGFTLIEVVIAAGMLAVVLLSSTQLVVRSSNNLGNDKMSALAIQIGSSNLEDLLNRYPSDALLTAGSHSLYFDNNGNPVASNGAITVTWVVTLDTPITNVMNIQETIQWTLQGSQKQYTLMTYRSET